MAWRNVNDGEVIYADLRPTVARPRGNSIPFRIQGATDPKKEALIIARKGADVYIYGTDLGQALFFNENGKPRINEGATRWYEEIPQSAVQVDTALH